MINAEAQSRGDAENELRTPNAERFVSHRHRVNPLFPCVSASLRLCVKNFSFLLSPSSFSPASPRLCASALKNPRRGATLLVTLGILTVLSIMAVTFLVATRLQQQTAVSHGQRLAARNQLNEALHLAMRTVEDAFCTTNFADATPPPDPPVPQRLAPVGRWFSEEWENRRGELSDDFSYQAPGVLTVPVSNHTAALQAAWSVNLFTPEVLALVPPALTNGLPLSSSDTRPLRSGWELIDAPSFDRTGARVAFAVFDVSGFLDANYFISGPTTQKLPRICFSQADVTNWVEKLSTLNAQLSTFNSEPDRVPFSSLSYDPNPDADPFISDSAEAHPLLGYEGFALSRQRKFDINSITNLIGKAPSESGNWLIADSLMGDWLRPVFSALSRANPQRSGKKETEEEADKHPDTLSTLQTVCVPWNLLNFIDGDRVPQLSPFANLPASLERIATRSNFAIEDVPLINKVTIFDIGEAPADKDPDDYYGINNYAEPGEYREGGVSNHYAVAVELWYPFSPNPMPSNMAFYAVLSTNAADTATTTNRPLTSSELRDWFNWNEAATSNTVMQTLFYAWADAYTHAVGPAVWQHPDWQVVTTNADLWFTTNMVSHPSWPVPDDTGHITITNTPVWHAFHPETYEVVTTNQVEFTDTNNVPYLVEIVTTNVYTYANTTNASVHWVAEPEMTTNRLAGQIGVTDPDPYPVLMWSDPETSLPATNVFLGFIDSAGATNLFFSEGQTNHLQAFYATPPDGIFVVSSNGLSGVLSTNAATALFVAPWSPDAPLEVSLQTNLVVVTEVEPLPPLPMPPELGATLDALFGMLLAPELNLDTSDKLFDFLMLRPNEFDQWDFLDNYLAQYPFIQQTIMPAVSRPRTDNLFPEDRIDLTDDNWPIPKFRGTEFEESGETVAEIFDKLSPPPDENSFTPKNGDEGFGTYITIYPRKTVSFPEEIVPELPDGSVDPDGVTVTNYYALGSQSEFVLYFRPVVTLDDKEGVSLTATATADGTLVDILDEALLVRETANVQPFHSVTNICVADPRHNASFRCWRGFPNSTYKNEPNDWDSAIGTTNLNTEVTEYPFIHLNRPLASIGEIGHVYTSPDRLNLSGFFESPVKYDEDIPLHDTISFATRPGAALLDLFTLHATPSNLPPHQTGVPWRGLVQANTYHPSVVETLFSSATLGWTNATDTSFLSDLSDSSDLSDWSDAYLDALTNAPPAGIGWRSFADMMPAISTNELLRSSFTVPFKDAPAHDWIEDAVRHLPDRVSFRQNIFVIVIAAQTLSPVSTPSRPVVLADQRAAVTVIRDAFTGRWTIYDWRWLNE